MKTSIGRSGGFLWQLATDNWQLLALKNCHWPIRRFSVKFRNQVADMDRRRPVTSSS
jgi:hypothetical protein